MPVEEVDEISPKLDAKALVEVEIFLEREIVADDSDIAGLRVGVGARAKRERRRIGEQRLVEIGVLRRPEVGDVEGALLETGRSQVAGRDVGAVHGAIPKARQRRRV